MEQLLAEVEDFIRHHGLSDAKFGKLALNDNKFVQQLRERRDLRMSTVDKVRAFMAAYRPEPAKADA